MKKFRLKDHLFALVVAVSLVFGSIPIFAQSDLVPVKDITGGSSVFVLRGGIKAAPKTYVSKARASRTKEQRNEATRRVSRQYVELAKVAPRRDRTNAVNPDRLPDIRRMPAAEASVMFAGVGEYWVDRNDYKQAAEFFDEAYRLDKTNNVARLGLSEALALIGNEELAQDNVPSARSRFREALQFNDKNAPAYFGLAEIAAAANDEEVATENYEKALSLDKDLTEIYVPLGILYYQQGQIAKAEDLLVKAIAKDANNAQTQFFIGLIRFAQNNNNAAMAAFEKARSLDPSYEEASYYIGEVHSRLERYSESIPEYRKAIALRDNYFEAWFGLANAQFELGQYQDAIASYNRALRLQNTNVEGYINLGDSYRLLGQYNDAEANYSIATSFMERTPDQDKTELAEVYSKIGYVIAKQCEIDRARNRACRMAGSLTAMEKAAALDSSVVSNGNLGWAYAQAGREDLYNNRQDAGRAKLTRAKELLEQAASSGGPNAEGALLNLAGVHKALGDNVASVNVLKRAADLNSRSPFVLNQLGLAYMDVANYKDAIAQFKKAVGRDDKFAEAHFNLGHAEFKNGNLNEAKKAYRKLRSMQGEDAANYAKQLETITNGAVRS